MLRAFLVAEAAAALPRGPMSRAAHAARRGGARHRQLPRPGVAQPHAADLPGRAVLVAPPAARRRGRHAVRVRARHAGPAHGHPGHVVAVVGRRRAAPRRGRRAAERRGGHLRAHRGRRGAGPVAAPARVDPAPVACRLDDRARRPRPGHRAVGPRVVGPDRAGAAPRAGHHRDRRARLRLSAAGRGARGGDAPPARGGPGHELPTGAAQLGPRDRRRCRPRPTSSPPRWSTRSADLAADGIVGRDDAPPPRGPTW